MINDEKVEPIKNFLYGGIGISIGLADITSIAQTIGAVCGAVLVVIQLYRTIKK